MLVMRIKLHLKDEEGQSKKVQSYITLNRRFAVQQITFYHKVH